MRQANPAFRRVVLGGGWAQIYLLYGQCIIATDPNQCLSYDADGFAYAEKEGLCVDDNYTTGLTPDLYMYAFGTCLPAHTLWNEAQVTGDFRDPGLDGYATNTVIFLGVVVDR